MFETLKHRYPQINSLDQLDFTNIKLNMEREREEKKNNPDEKARVKRFKEDQNRFYGTAIVDGMPKNM